jgi:hypothetical protein
MNGGVKMAVKKTYTEDAQGGNERIKSASSRVQSAIKRIKYNQSTASETGANTMFENEEIQPSYVPNDN